MDVSVKWNLSINDRKVSKDLLTWDKAVDQQKIGTFHNNHSERAISSNNYPFRADGGISNGYTCKNHLPCDKANLLFPQA